MKWNDDDITTFLNIYRQYPLLWNEEDKYYNNTKFKEEIFQCLYNDLIIEKLIGRMDVKELKAKIKSIKDVLRQELHKIKKSKRNGDEEIYTSKLTWFKDAYYLTDVITKRRSRKKLDLPRNNQNPEPRENNDTSMESAEYAIDKSKEEHKARTKMISPATPTKKLNRQAEFENIPSEVNSFQQLDPTRNVNEKPYEHFGAYVAAELRQLPQRQAIMLQQEIQNCIIRFKLLRLNQKDYLDLNFTAIDASHDNGKRLNN